MAQLYPPVDASPDRGPPGYPVATARESPPCLVPNPGFPSFLTASPLNLISSIRSAPCIHFYTLTYAVPRCDSHHKARLIRTPLTTALSGRVPPSQPPPTSTFFPAFLAARVTSTTGAPNPVSDHFLDPNSTQRPAVHFLCPLSTSRSVATTHRPI